MSSGSDEVLSYDDNEFEQYQEEDEVVQQWADAVRPQTASTHTSARSFLSDQHRPAERILQPRQASSTSTTTTSAATHSTRLRDPNTILGEDKLDRLKTFAYRRTQDIPPLDRLPQPQAGFARDPLAGGVTVAPQPRVNALARAPAPIQPRAETYTPAPSQQDAESRPQSRHSTVSLHGHPASTPGIGLYENPSAAAGARLSRPPSQFPEADRALDHSPDVSRPSTAATIRTVISAATETPRPDTATSTRLSSAAPQSTLSRPEYSRQPPVELASAPRSSRAPADTTRAPTGGVRAGPTPITKATVSATPPQQAGVPLGAPKAAVAMPGPQDRAISLERPSSASQPQAAQQFQRPPSQQPSSQIQAQPLPAEDRLKNVLSYLDHVEQNSEDIISQITSRARVRATPPTTNTATILSVPTFPDPATRPAPTPSVDPIHSAADMQSEIEGPMAKANSITSKLMKQRNEHETLKKQFSQLQDMHRASQEKHAAELREREEGEQIRSAGVREEYEGTIKRHLSFIDQMMADKASLTTRCEELSQQQKSVQAKFTAKIRAMEEAATMNLRQQREAWVAAEKVKREKWMEEQSQKIKEQTIKGLEPEIERMMNQHKLEIKKLKELQEMELAKMKEGESYSVNRQVEQLRNRLEQEKEEAIIRERENARTRYQGLAANEEKIFQEQRAKLMLDVQEERNKMMGLMKEERAKMESELKRSRELDEKTVAKIREDCDRKIEEMAKRHIGEENEMKERLAIEKESWEQMYMRKQQANLKLQEEQMRDALRKERDQEINIVINKLEEEGHKQQKEAEQQAEVRIRRMKEKQEAQLKDVEQSERAALAKYNEMKQKHALAVEEVSTLRGGIAQRERELDDVRQLLERLTRERNNVAEIIRGEFIDRITTLEADVERSRGEVSDARRSHREEVRKLMENKDTELDALNQRVRSAIAKKDETISALRDQFQAATLRADHLEQLLESHNQLLK
eukprot:m.55708 g.55708  ORF g.55708 m.55708 type:complete len:978 (-) comp48907_c0_seq1:2666-5599(-)